jgi:hypothetical protein
MRPYVIATLVAQFCINLGQPLAFEKDGFPWTQSLFLLRTPSLFLSQALFLVIKWDFYLDKSRISAMAGT